MISAASVPRLPRLRFRGVRVLLPMLMACLAACCTHRDPASDEPAQAPSAPEATPTTAEPTPAEDEPAAIPEVEAASEGEGSAPLTSPAEPGDGAESAEGPQTSAETTPTALYEACRDRVEGPEEPGECAEDGDCARAGCGSEVCVAASRAGEIFTTCEVRPCFSVLEACTCQEGVCTWTLTDTVPEQPEPNLPDPSRVLPR